MKNIRILSLLLLICTISCEKDSDFERIPIADLKVSKWNNGASSAVSFIWDDDIITQFITIEPIFSSLGYKTSFGVITGQASEYNEYYKELVKRGHELCSHTHLHRDLSKLSDDEIHREIRLSKEYLHEKFGVTASTLIHPHNHTNNNVNNIFKSYYLFSRIYSEFEDENRVIYNMSSGTNLPRLLTSFLKSRDGKWLICAGHGVDDYGFGAISSSDLIDFLTMLKSSDDLIWVDSFKNIALYSEIRDLIENINVIEDLIILDDSNIDYDRYARFNIEKIPITITINCDVDKYEFIGDNIINKKFENGKYYVTIDLLVSKQIKYRDK